MKFGHNLHARYTEETELDKKNVLMDVPTAFCRGVNLEYILVTVSGGINVC
jgi:hypothetical protein